MKISKDKNEIEEYHVPPEMNPTASYVCIRTDKVQRSCTVFCFRVRVLLCIRFMRNVHVCLSYSMFIQLTASLKDFTLNVLCTYQISITWNWVSTLGLAN
jgi:hypothetical protein